MVYIKNTKGCGLLDDVISFIGRLDRRDLFDESGHQIAKSFTKSFPIYLLFFHWKYIKSVKIVNEFIYMGLHLENMIK